MANCLGCKKNYRKIRENHLFCSEDCRSSYNRAKPKLNNWFDKMNDLDIIRINDSLANLINIGDKTYLKNLYKKHGYV